MSKLNCKTSWSLALVSDHKLAKVPFKIKFLKPCIQLFHLLHSLKIW
jgi:hypothetical protein